MAGEDDTTHSQSGGQSPLSVDKESDAFAERPEVYVGGAFVGGLAVALILRALGNR